MRREATTPLVLDVRTTKFFALGGDRRIGLFAEFFNVFNTVNFGSNYGGNARGATFRQPTAFLAEHRLSAPAAARRAVPVLTRFVSRLLVIADVFMMRDCRS